MESGHGKGAMDGVGGSLKRNADQHVLHGKDIMSAKDLVEALCNSSTNIIEVLSSDIKAFKRQVPEKLPAIKGIMGIRQLFWNGKYFFGRKLSCFECENECRHFHFNIIENVMESNKKEKLPTKVRLRVSDVNSSEDESEESSSVQKTITFNSNYGNDDLKPRTFVVVSFEMGKTKKQFVAVIQSEMSNDLEIEVLFMKQTKDANTFQPDQNDIA
ncbi:hypothetical protein J6590_088148 [Homalodisca vitripennis]|nr:hypothetical protein J6590_088148 [Homalodisca vitripennis]